MRILNVLNFSNWRNPAADSGIRLQQELIQAIARKRHDYFFYLLIPREVEREIRSTLEGANVQLIPTTSMSRQQGGAHHFDLRELDTLLDLRRIDIDVLFINQPELTAGLLGFFNKVHFFDLHSFNYIHWMDWQRRDEVKNRWNVPGNLTLLTSVLMSQVTGCNSAYGKSRIVEEASRWFNDSTTSEIERKLVPLHPGIQVPEICAAKSRSRHRLKTIIYPFRALKYTGFRALIDHLAALWEKRQDFRVIITNPSNYDYIKKLPERLPFLEVGRFDRPQYLRELWKADIVVACHNGSSQWSLAAVEALAAECIPLFNSESFLVELFAAALPGGLPSALLDRYFYYRSEFPRRLEYLLDNINEERKKIRPIAEQVRTYYDWTNRVDDWIRCFDAADQASPELRGQTDVSRRIDAVLGGCGSILKEDLMRELDWHVKSRHISWTRYRKYLRSNYFEDHRSPFVRFSASAKILGPRPSRQPQRLDGRGGVLRT
jgi:glycosyltransferase involved in cell wall biosynthesis